MEIKVYHNQDLIIKSDIWKLVLGQILNKPFGEIINIDDLKVFVNGMELPKPKDMEPEAKDDS